MQKTYFGFDIQCITRQINLVNFDQGMSVYYIYQITFISGMESYPVLNWLYTDFISFAVADGRVGEYNATYQLKLI